MLKYENILDYCNFTMKKLIPAIAVIISCVSLIGCGSAPKDTVKEDASNSVTQSQAQTFPVAATEQENKQESATQENKNNQEEKKKQVRKNLDENPKKTESNQPKVGTVKKLVNGDLMCYHLQ
jgi:flagellum-specific peptidoglycan hydrolase FlgJ